jgi:excisionase family DNA binding protein
MTLMSYPETAEYLGLTLNTLYWKVARGDIPHIRIAPRTVRFCKETLDRWLLDRIVAGPNPVLDAGRGCPLTTGAAKGDTDGR